MEPERRIEKLLRAFAKKRREQAGDPVELRPGVRQQLHQEISRRAEGKRSGSFFSNLFGFRPRLAFALCFIAIVAVGGWLLSPVFIGRKPGTLASANSQLSAVAPTAPAPSVAVAEDKGALDDERRMLYGSLDLKPGEPKEVADNRAPVLSDSDAVKQTSVLENGIAQNSPSAGPAVASTTGADREMPVYKTDGATVDSFASAPGMNKDITEKQPPSAAPLLDTNGTKVTTLALVAGEQAARKKSELQKTSAPSVASSAASYDFAKSEVTADVPFASQRFYRMDAPVTRQHSAEALSVPAPVLTSFRMEQSGGKIRVVDADGSVYTGAVQVVRDESAPAATPPATLQNKPSSAMAANIPSQPSAVQNYFFRVTGTNRNLNQNIVFSGNLIPLTNTGGFGGGGAGARRTMPESPGSSSLMNSRISGKAVIGDQKEIEVNATPTPQ